MNRRNYSGRGKRELFKKTAFFIGVVAAVFAAASVLSKVAGTDRPGFEEHSTEQIADVIEINGIKCRPKSNIRTWLFIGADSPGTAKTVEGEEVSGQCDVLELLVLDKTAGIYTRLSINRDTMTDVKSLEKDGTYIATSRVQIAFAHAEGDGMEISCENTVDAVSDFLYGQKIDGYISLGMDAIPVLNGLCGGVTVTVRDDFSKTDPSLQQGETLKLSDEQAMHYVHDRQNVGDGTNEGRMRRQQEYLAGLSPLLMEKCRADKEYPLEIYDGLADYMVTDMSRNDFIKAAAALLDAEEQEPAKIEGTNAIGAWDFNEFTPDKDKLADTVIQLFYDKVEE